MIVGRVLSERAAQMPDRVAVVHRGKRITFGQLERGTTALAEALATSGVGRGDRVVLILPNCSEFVYGYIAALKIGAVSVPVDPRVKGEELQYMFGEMMPRAVITTAVEEVRAITDGLNHPCAIFPAGPGSDFQSIVSREPGAIQELPLEGHDDALYLYTSGTTGRPKAVMLTFDHLDHFPLAMRRLLATDERDVVGFLLPMSHISGPIVINLILSDGSRMVIFDELRPDQVLSTMQRERVTFFHAVPPIFQLLLQVSDYQRYDVSSLRLVAMMGTSVPISLIKEFSRRYPSIPVVQGYGLTETSPLLTLLPVEAAQWKLGSMGRAVPGAEMRIVDDQDREVPVGQFGEIVVRGPVVMKGYYGDPEATAQMIVDGWLHTGDYGRVDEDGFYYHVGRKKEMIITGGLNLHPAEVEEVLFHHPKIKEAAVLGVPDEKRGEVVKAVVVVNEGESLDRKELLAYCRKRLTSFKVPQIVEFREKLPRNPMGKVIKEELT